VSNLKTLSQCRNLTIKPFLNRAAGRILEVLPGKEFAIVQVPDDGDKQFLNVLFDLNRLRMKNKQNSMKNSVMPGYPVLVNAAQIEPAVPGYTDNIPYYASAVTIDDPDEHDSQLVSFSALQTDSSVAISEGLKLSKAALSVQLDLCAKGEITPLFHSLADTINFGTGIVVMKNQSVLLVKLLHQRESCYALQILESVLLTQDDESLSESFEVGETLRLNAVLVHPGHSTQYLITTSWSADVERAIIPRSDLKLLAFDMFHTLAASYCHEPGVISLIDESSFVVPTAHGIGFDDIVEDIGDFNSDIVDRAVLDSVNNIPEASDVSNVQEEHISESDQTLSKPFIGIKIASFAKQFL